MRAQARAGRRRIRLNGISLVKITLVIQLTQKPPYGFDISVVVGDIGVVHVYPVTHTVGKRLPLAGIFHYFRAACCVVVIDADLLADILFSDTKVLFDAEFHRQSVGVPSGLALYVKTLHGLVAAENVLDRASHHMMYAGHSVCRRRPLVKDERWASFALLYALAEQTLAGPVIKHLFIYSRQIKTVIFLEFIVHRESVLKSRCKVTIICSTINLFTFRK